MKRVVWLPAVLALVVASSAPRAQQEDPGPVGPSPYEVVRGWHKPFAEPGFAFGGNSGVFAESPDRIFVAQRGEFRLPTPVPAEFTGFAGSLKMNVLTLADRRVWKNCLYTLDRNGAVKERWTQWDRLCEGSDGPGPHRLRISPYDRCPPRLGDQRDLPPDLRVLERRQTAAEDARREGRAPAPTPHISPNRRTWRSCPMAASSSPTASTTTG